MAKDKRTPEQAAAAYEAKLAHEKAARDTLRAQRNGSESVPAVASAASTPAYPRSPTGPARTGFTGHELRTRLQQYDRVPFLDLVAMWLESAPTAEDIDKLARTAPDKWASAIGQMARTAGFTEKTETQVNVNVAVAKLSDSQLEDRIKRLNAELGIEDAEFEAIEDENDVAS